MESPLCPVLADVFLANFERTKLKGAVDEMIYFSRYVCDTFIVRNNQQHATSLLKYSNEAHPNMQFTMEHENDNKFNFLDVTIKRRKDRVVQRSFYKKDTWIGIFSNSIAFV